MVSDVVMMFLYRSQEGKGGYAMPWSSAAQGAIAAVLYEEKQGGPDVGKDVIAAVFGRCSAGLVITYLLYLCSIKRRYLSTFFSMQTGYKFIQDGGAAPSGRTTSSARRYSNTTKPGGGRRSEPRSRGWVGEALDGWCESPPVCGSTRRPKRKFPIGL